jgi:peptide-methionine (R)-S-oxide reductase
MKTNLFVLILVTIASTSSCQTKARQEGKKTPTINKTEAEWRKILTPEQYHVLREQGTERPFTGKDWDNHEVGTYYCAACHLELFSSETKFESGTGWPSFYQPIKEGVLAVGTDNSYGMVRDEVECAQCSGHLGHVFNDGPAPTGLRYCMNSVSMVFEKKAKK